MKTAGLKAVSIWLVATVLSLGIAVGYAAKTGQKLNNVKIKNANDKASWIPGFGKKVLTVIYADIQAADTNDPLADKLKARKFDDEKYEGIGVANLKDTWAPDAIVRAIIRRKIKKYNSTILVDDDYSIPKAWGLGDCDDVSVVVVIGKDKKVKYVKKGAVRGAEIQKVLDIVASEIAK